MEAISGRWRWVNSVGVGGVRGPWGETGVRVWEEGLVPRARRGSAAGRGAGGTGMSLLLAPVPRLLDL